MAIIMVKIEAEELPAGIVWDLDCPIAEVWRSLSIQASFCSLGVADSPMDVEDRAVVLCKEEDRWAKGVHDGLLPPS